MQQNYPPHTHTHVKTRFWPLRAEVVHNRRGDKPNAAKLPWHENGTNMTDDAYYSCLPLRGAPWPSACNAPLPWPTWHTSMKKACTNSKTSTTRQVNLDMRSVRPAKIMRCTMSQGKLQQSRVWHPPRPRASKKSRRGPWTTPTKQFRWTYMVGNRGAYSAPRAYTKCDARKDVKWGSGRLQPHDGHS